MKSLILITAGLILNSSFALTTTTNSCLSNECLKERATSFKVFLKSEEAFTNEYSEKFPNKMLQKLTNNLISEIATDFRDGSVDRQTALGQFKANIRENGIHNGLLNPAIVFMDMYASMGMSDKVLGIANIVNTLNPSVGDELEKTFGIEIDRGYDLDAVKIDHDKESPFGGPRMGNFENDFGDESEAPETGVVDGLAPRMGDSQFGVNEGEMVSPILANKLEQDKNSLLYATSSTSSGDVKTCLVNCLITSGMAGLGGGKLGPYVGLGAALIVGGVCMMNCNSELKDYYKGKSQKQDKPKTDSPKIDNPRTGIGAPDMPEDKPENPDTPKVDNPRTGGGDQPKSDDTPKGDNTPKGDDEPINPKEPKNTDDGGECKGKKDCSDGRMIVFLGRVKNDIEVIDDNVNLNRVFNVNFKDLQINYGRPQLGM